MVEKNEVTTSAEAVDKPWIVQEDELDMPVWRYMDFAKYIDILENSCLYFSPINGFEDKLEGFNNVLNEGLTYKLDTSGDVPKIVSTQEVLTHPVEIDNAKKFKTFFKETEEKYKASIGVSCWRMDTSESHAMWKVYVKSNEGIAIKSSIRLVKESVQLELLQNLEAIKVQYIDYNHQVLDMVKSLAIGIYHKSNNYNDDKEIRFIYNEIITEKPAVWKPIPDSGISIPINTNKLINQVIISPYAPKWFSGLLNKVSRHYGLHAPVTKSGIHLR